MKTDTRQIERLRFSLRTFRQYAMKVLDEMEDQINAISGSEPETDSNWKDEFDDLVKDINGK